MEARMTLPEPEVPGHISFSSLTTFTDCNYKWYLTRVEQVPEAKAYALPAGSAFHHACDVYDLDLLAKQEPPF